MPRRSSRQAIEKPRCSLMPSAIQGCHRSRSRRGPGMIQTGTRPRADHDEFQGRSRLPVAAFTVVGNTTPVATLSFSGGTGRAFPAERDHERNDNTEEGRHEAASHEHQPSRRWHPASSSRLRSREPRSRGFVVLRNRFHSRMDAEAVVRIARDWSPDDSRFLVQNFYGTSE